MTPAPTPTPQRTFYYGHNGKPLKNSYFIWPTSYSGGEFKMHARARPLFERTDFGENWVVKHVDGDAFVFAPWSELKQAMKMTDKTDESAFLEAERYKYHVYSYGSLEDLVTKANAYADEAYNSGEFLFLALGGPVLEPVSRSFAVVDDGNISLNRIEMDQMYPYVKHWYDHVDNLKAGVA
jgi:hypothetical protein